VGGDAAVLLVLGKLDDPEEDVRTAAVRAAAVLRGERTGKILLGRLEEEESQDVQVEILKALGQLGDPVAVPAIEKRAVGSFFARPPAEIRIAAYRALAAIRTPHARQLVEAAAQDKDPEVKSVAKGLVMAAEREARTRKAEAATAAAAAATPTGAAGPES
jgi:HEAT repeat protein